MNKYTFLLLRLGIAMSMFGHGLVRLPKLQAFAKGVSEQFAASLLPSVLIYPFGYGIAITEFIIGILLILGLFTRLSLVIGGFLMIFLILGSCLIENFGALSSQMIHLAFFALLIPYTTNNYLALDNVIKVK